MSVPIVDLGSGPWSGAYLLRIVVAQTDMVVFGRFAGGAAVVVEPANYLYIGSGQSSHDDFLLARRVLRHLTRTSGRPPQNLRHPVLAYLQAHGWPAAHPPDGKTLRWHVDYLLDRPVADVAQVLLFRDGRVDERQLVARVMETGWVVPLVSGLGASDHPRHTHLLRWTGDSLHWEQFICDLTQRLATSS